MPQVQETIPESLRPTVNAALAWINRERSAEFAVTGIVDAEASDRDRQSGNAVELQLVLCDADTCLRERFRVRPLDAGFDVAAQGFSEGASCPLPERPQYAGA